MKKIVALWMIIFVVLGAFAGCGKENPGSQGSGPAGDNSQKPDAAGTLVVTAIASVRVAYNEDGLVLYVEGLNKNGDNLVDLAGDAYEGASCTTVVGQIIKDSLTQNYMYDTNHVVVKIDKGAALPGTNFAETIRVAAQNALDIKESTAALVFVGQENLNEDGFIDLSTAKILVEKFLKWDVVVNLDGTSRPIDDQYAF